MTADVADRRRCPDCTAGHDHCHETLLVHGDGTLECLGAGPCDRTEEGHPLVVDCRQLAPPCGCEGPVPPAAGG